MPMQFRFPPPVLSGSGSKSVISAARENKTRAAPLTERTNVHWVQQETKKILTLLTTLFLHYAALHLLVAQTQLPLDTEIRLLQH
jgi:hypothetical protein